MCRLFELFKGKTILGNPLENPSQYFRSIFIPITNQNLRSKRSFASMSRNDWYIGVGSILRIEKSIKFSCHALQLQPEEKNLQQFRIPRKKAFGVFLRFPVHVFLTSIDTHVCTTIMKHVFDRKRLPSDVHGDFLHVRCL